MRKNDAHEPILSHTLFLQREYRVSHLAYDREMEFYETVKAGDLARLKKIMLPLDNEKLGKLSNNPLRNLKYHLIVTIAMITRFCIEGGLPSETAYTLSDIYIQKADACADEDEIGALHRKAVFDFARKMQGLRAKGGLSRSVVRAIDYVYDHLQERVSLTAIARAAGVNGNYLCELFKKETGMTVFEYVMKLRIEAASNMLLQADYKSADIASYFAFSSHSHFIKVFKKYAGMTPEEFRKRNYRTGWEKKARGRNRKGEGKTER
jgi:YesN/AraC family two-component response regulator